MKHIDDDIKSSFYLGNTSHGYTIWYRYQSGIVFISITEKRYSKLISKKIFKRYTNIFFGGSNKSASNFIIGELVLKDLITEL